MVDIQSVPATPKVIAPSPTSSEYGDSSSQYYPPVTRSSAKQTISQKSRDEEKELEIEREARSRTRSRSPHVPGLKRRGTGAPSTKSRQRSFVQRSEPLVLNGLIKDVPNGVSNGNLLSPKSAYLSSSYWRAISRSPSPLGLIPIHRYWRSFVHRHEVPRKLLHVSIGFLTLWLYTSGVQKEQIHPVLLAMLIPVASVDFVRHRSEDFNRVYIKICGALMRETEVHDRYNGVVFYIAGAWVAMCFFPKDVAVMSVLLLSWCDTAASTFGRLFGKYTPRIRKGKSVAGSSAALLTGILTAWIWYGYFVPSYFGFDKDFMFKGTLRLPAGIRNLLGLDDAASTVDRNVALLIMSIVCGCVASVSELVDVYGLDDNITIPILSAMGIWGFLKIFA